MILLIRCDLCFYDQTGKYNLMNIESLQYKASLAITGAITGSSTEKNYD